ncbi:MAG: purine-binding chemotaxis protein CheW [Nitrospinota bacterium]|nr:MAG: purine-binding chemotaxis protein CheW [Nitrospinota bacterium]
MPEIPYLIFRLHETFYGVEATAVQEILWLPELTPLTQAPGHIVGTMNLRGRTVPVMDLGLRLGQPRQRYQLTDNVIVLAQGEQRLGVIVTTVYDVLSLTETAMEEVPLHQEQQPDTPRIVTALAHDGEKTFLLLNHQALLHDSLTDTSPEALPSPACAFAVSEEEREVLRERARQLRQAPESRQESDTLSLAVIRLHEEHFGVELDVIQEFVRCPQITPIPCCPPYIVGDMNLRGNILTIVDIRMALHLPLTPPRSPAEIMVVQVADLQVGVLIDAVCDVISLPSPDMHPVPVAVQVPGPEYLQGTAVYNGKILGVLDLPKLLTREDWIINEEA